MFVEYENLLTIIVWIQSTNGHFRCRKDFFIAFLLLLLLRDLYFHNWSHILLSPTIVF